MAFLPGSIFSPGQLIFMHFFNGEGHRGRSSRDCETGYLSSLFRVHFFYAYEEFNSQNIYYQFSKNLIQAYLRAIYEWLEIKIIILSINSSKPYLNFVILIKKRVYIVNQSCN